MIGGNITASFQKYTTYRNEIGERVQEWFDVFQKKGFLDYKSGGADYDYSTKLQDSTHLFMCDYFDYKALELTPETARLLIDGEKYDIMMIDDPMGLHQHLEIHLEYLGGQ